LKDSDTQSESQRILDLLLLLVFLPLWLPAIAICALLVWLSDPIAPIAYRQVRVGRHGRLQRTSLAGFQDEQ